MAQADGYFMRQQCRLWGQFQFRESYIAPMFSVLRSLTKYIVRFGTAYDISIGAEASGVIITAIQISNYPAFLIALARMRPSPLNIKRERTILNHQPRVFSSTMLQLFSFFLGLVSVVVNILGTSFLVRAGVTSGSDCQTLRERHEW